MVGILSNANRCYEFPSEEGILVSVCIVHLSPTLGVRTELSELLLPARYPVIVQSLRLYVPRDLSTYNIALHTSLTDSSIG